ncbi:MAG TPA: HWE histidine kinase domain-containing protein [Stellaceae bacterium]|nr:HWE histidine kinase domain-containing protein [Stellaceae bacterium]
MSDNPNPVKPTMPTVPSGNAVVPLDAILCTEELSRRPHRPPDYETENRALAALVQALADSPQTILQTLADTLLEVFKADSAGISLLTGDEKNFYWAAIAGDWKPHLGGGTPRNFGPCGDVLDCNAPLLFKHWERRYSYLLQATPLAEEGLLVPFHVRGKAVGTIWTIAHTQQRKFDAEDLRHLESLGRFASAAYQTVQLQNAEEARRIALDLMEEAVRSRKAVEELNDTLRESEERYRTLFELGPVAVYSCDAAGAILNYNRQAADLWGREPAAGEHFSGARRLFHPDGSPMPHDQCPTARVLNGSEARISECMIERPDGSRLTVVAEVRKLKDRRGDVAGAISCFYDITERKRDELRQQLLIDELNHRVKNTLATVQSIAAHTLTAASDAESRRKFDERLIALARAHDLVAQRGWEGASLRELLLQELEPYGAGSREPFVLAGPDVDLRPKAALALGLAFHELATNAAKHGALSAPGGSIRVDWERVNGSKVSALRLKWAETGGPAITVTPKKSFGLTVIERGLSLELDGTVTIAFDPEGLTGIIEFPLPTAGEANVC